MYDSGSSSVTAPPHLIPTSSFTSQGIMNQGWEEIQEHAAQCALQEHSHSRNETQSSSAPVIEKESHFKRLAYLSATLKKFHEKPAPAPQRKLTDDAAAAVDKAARRATRRKQTDDERKVAADTLERTLAHSQDVCAESVACESAASLRTNDPLLCQIQAAQQKIKLDGKKATPAKHSQAESAPNNRAGSQPEKQVMLPTMIQKRTLPEPLIRDATLEEQAAKRRALASPDSEENVEHVVCDAPAPPGNAASGTPMEGPATPVKETHTTSQQTPLKIDPPGTPGPVKGRPQAHPNPMKRVKAPVKQSDMREMRQKFLTRAKGKLAHTGLPKKDIAKKAGEMWLKSECRSKVIESYSEKERKRRRFTVA